MLGHEANGPLAGGRIPLHVELPVEFVPRVEEKQVVARADEFVNLPGRETVVEVNGFDFDAMFGQETPGLAAGGSSGFGVEPGLWHG